MKLKIELLLYRNWIILWLIEDLNAIRLDDLKCTFMAVDSRLPSKPEADAVPPWSPHRLQCAHNATVRRTSRTHLAKWRWRRGLSAGGRRPSRRLGRGRSTACIGCSVLSGHWEPRDQSFKHGLPSTGTSLWWAPFSRPGLRSKTNRSRYSSFSPTSTHIVKTKHFTVNPWGEFRCVWISTMIL